MHLVQHYVIFPEMSSPSRVLRSRPFVIVDRIYYSLQYGVQTIDSWSLLLLYRVLSKSTVVATEKRILYWYYYVPYKNDSGNKFSH